MNAIEVISRKLLCCVAPPRTIDCTVFSGKTCNSHITHKPRFEMKHHSATYSSTSFLKAVNSFVYCHLVINVVEYFISFLFSEKFDGSLSIKNTCKCPLSCHQVAYELDFSSAKIPSAKYEQFFSTQDILDLS